MPWFLYSENKILALVQWWANGIKLSDPLTGLRVIRGELLSGWVPRFNGFDIEAELNYHVKRLEFWIVELLIKYRKRIGEKKLRFRDSFRILVRMLNCLRR